MFPIFTIIWRAKVTNLPVTDSPRRHPALSIILILLVVFLGFVVIGPMLGVLAALPFFPGSLTDLMTVVGDFEGRPEGKVPLYIIQAFATGVGLIALPRLYVRFADAKLYASSSFGHLNLRAGMLTLAAVLSFMVVNSVFIEWNANVHLPSSLKAFEDWARRREDYAEALTRYLTRFDHAGQFVLAFFVIAVLPAWGEEYVFRGLLQTELTRWTGNTHFAVWTSALLFSSIHMQFFGFVPRMFLGALFGYLYAWSGNLSVATLAHFINNAFSLVIMYLHQLGYLDIDLESTEAEPWPMVLAFAVITGLVLHRLRKTYLEKPAAPVP
jgi:hypothetical protein